MCAVRTIRLEVGAAAVAMAWVLCGCRGAHKARPNGVFPIPGPAPHVASPASVQPIQPSLPFAPLASYRLRPGDQLGFTLHILPSRGSSSYPLSAGDRLTIEYLHLPADARRAADTRVKPDGTIDLHLVGEVAVAGLTIQQASEAINERAKQYWKHPQVTLAITDPLARAEELRRTFAVGGVFNQALSLPVGPDGAVVLPVIGAVPAYGRTIAELRVDLTERYQQVAPGVEITPLLQQRAPDRVYVLGEIARQGLLTLDRPTTVIQAIAQSGGAQVSAELREVLLVRGFSEGQYSVTVLDLDKALDRRKCRQNVDFSDDRWLQDGDVVIVPKDKIANLNDFVERVFARGVYGALPVPYIASPLSLQN